MTIYGWSVVILVFACSRAVGSRQSSPLDIETVVQTSSSRLTDNVSLLSQQIPKQRTQYPII